MTSTILDKNLFIVDILLDHYSNILHIIIKSETFREKVLALIYCSSVYTKRERFIHWYDPYFVYDDKISDTSTTIQSRLRLRFAFKDYKALGFPSAHCWEPPIPRRVFKL